MHYVSTGAAPAPRSFKRLVLLAAVLAITTVVVAAAWAAGGGAVVKVGSTGLGRVLVDAHGKTLYIWAHDKSSTSTCNGDCAGYWPPLVTKGRPQAIAGANSRLLGTSKRKDGRMQVTYAGHPLYYFVQDTKAGQTKGEGLTGFGGRWDPISASGRAVRKQTGGGGGSYGADAAPLQASVISPGAGDTAGTAGTFSVEVSLQARNAQSNSLLAGYKAAFNDPSKPTFHPGPNAAAPGLVVLLSTTPTIAGTPLQGANTNLAGVFQINDVSQAKGLTRTFNSWIVTSAGFFGKGVKATLTVYAVDGTAPALLTGTEKPISNVVRESFTIAG
jgi:predicted lipoprotein with Yx(FWY)xxD motif